MKQTIGKYLGTIILIIGLGVVGTAIANAMLGGPLNPIPNAQKAYDQAVQAELTAKIVLEQSQTNYNVTRQSRVLSECVLAQSKVQAENLGFEEPLTDEQRNELKTKCDFQ